MTSAVGVLPLALQYGFEVRARWVLLLQPSCRGMRLCCSHPGTLVEPSAWRQQLHPLQSEFQSPCCLYRPCATLSPLSSLQVTADFLAGAHDIDVHFRDAPFERNLPVLMGLIRRARWLADGCGTVVWRLCTFSPIGRPSAARQPRAAPWLSCLSSST